MKTAITASFIAFDVDRTQRIPNIDWRKESWDAYLASPADFAGAHDIINNLPKEREPGDIERTP